ncbi:hypothetical protein MXB_322 [Myxobolus squamalis]|nr:hypothetical protein MXB_322 [Myxobolus squamalis]
MKYSVVIFDTAPTGHTLKLLSFPISLSKTVSKLHEFKSTLFPLLKQVGSLFGSDFNLEPILNKVEAAIPIIEMVSAQLRDPTSTTFVCVCIAEFLSMYETERLIQQLTTMNVNVNTIIINQLVENNQACARCELCTSRANSQQKYVEQIEEMYDDYHLIKSFLLPFEVRGIDQLKIYSKFLME